MATDETFEVRRDIELFGTLNSYLQMLQNKCDYTEFIRVFSSTVKTFQ